MRVETAEQRKCTEQLTKWLRKESMIESVIDQLEAARRPYRVLKSRNGMVAVFVQPVPIQRPVPPPRKLTCFEKG